MDLPEQVTGAKEPLSPEVSISGHGKLMGFRLRRTESNGCSAAAPWSQQGVVSWPS